MSVTENHELAFDLLQHVKAILRGEITVPPASYTRDKSLWHRSDLLGCVMQAYLSRSVDEEPEISDRAALLFMRGRAIERFLGADNAPVVRDDVLVTADMDHPRHGLVEFKSTASKMSNPIYKHWTEECRVLAHAHNVDAVSLAVIYVVGENRGGLGGKDPALQAWTLTFTDAEREAAWAEMMRRKGILDAALRTGDAPTYDVVRPTISSWGCGDCAWALWCPTFTEHLHERSA